MADYLLFTYDDPTAFADLAPEEIQAIIERYSAWAAALRTSGTMIDSNKLADDKARVLRAIDGDVRVTDGPFSETKEVIAGYFLIRAESWDAAVEIARTCPHVERGAVEIRQIDAL